ncbi:MAG: hypothetical protein UHX00_06625 [Caryophanon sp.]|nr:hypothetical protein [Caryophanon sp.]
MKHLNLKCLVLIENKLKEVNDMWDKVLGAVVVAVATEIAREVIKEDN